jgi:hypothetical protein
MDGFLLDCCFNSGYDGRKIRESTPRCANRLYAMHHCAEPHHFYAAPAPAPGKSLDAAPASAAPAPAPTLLNSKAKFLKQVELNMN